MKALITGSGQDSAFLAKVLIDKGYDVYIGTRRSSNNSIWRHDYLKVTDKIKQIDLDLLDYGNILRVIKENNFDHIYNLAAMSFVGNSWNQPVLTYETNTRGVLYLLEAVRLYSPKAKFYQASTSEMFGKVQATPQNETTPFYPRSPYGVSKLAAHWSVVNYRESFDIFGCSGILFNHESELRGSEFVTKKITEFVGKYHKKETSHPLQLGNLEAKRDWGYAYDFVKAMNLMLESNAAEDYVIATGETHSVREFIEKAFAQIDVEVAWEGKGINEVGIDKKSNTKIVEVTEKFFRPAEVDLLIGDPSKATKNLGWKPTVGFSKLVEIMVKYEIEQS